jgi:hypothetical protein
MAALFEPIRAHLCPPPNEVNDMLLFTGVQKSHWPRGCRKEVRHFGDMAQPMSSSPYLSRIDGLRVSRRHLQLRVELMKRNVRGT